MKRIYNFEMYSEAATQNFMRIFERLGWKPSPPDEMGNISINVPIADEETLFALMELTEI